MTRYKTYEAETLQQAILKMTIDLGRDAILVSHRTKRDKGIRGLFGKKIVEVTGTLPINSIHDLKEKKPSVVSNRASLIAKAYSPTRGVSGSSASAVLERDDHRISSSLHMEIREIKGKMEDLLKTIKGKGELGAQYPGRTGELYIKLIQSEVSQELAEELIEKLATSLPPSSLENRELLIERLESFIVEMVKVDGSLNLNKGPFPKAVAFVGPTGVGKTTTLAKLAANISLNEGKKVGLITIDTYRIAAVEQLRTYAEIINLPLKVVFTPEEFKEALRGYHNMDLVLIDTAGRSPRNYTQMDELKNFIDVAYRLETYLLMNATRKYRDLLDVVENFRRVSFDRVIFTKLDETVTFGPILDIMNKISQPLSYITNGQNVPEDIELCDPHKLARRIIEGR
jgi:flagellar biosynthesis protein FlhF